MQCACKLSRQVDIWRYHHFNELLRPAAGLPYHQCNVCSCSSSSGSTSSRPESDLVVAKIVQNCWKRINNTCQHALQFHQPALFYLTIFPDYWPALPSWPSPLHPDQHLMAISTLANQILLIISTIIEFIFAPWLTHDFLCWKRSRISFPPFRSNQRI